jgi:stage V sporulation protein S
MDVIKVAGSSRTSSVAGAIAGVFREHHHAEVQAIGAGAVNQAVKALVLASSYLDKDGFQISFMPRFSDVEIDGKTRTAIKFYVVLYEGEAEVADPSLSPVAKVAPVE